MNAVAVSDQTDAALERLPDQLTGVLARAGRVISVEAVRAVPEVKLTPPQFRILYFLLSAPGASLSDVAAHLGVRLPTASVMLMKLEADGYVDRRRDPNSRRRMQLSLSDHGQRVMIRARATIEARLRAAFARLEEREQEELLRFLPLFDRFLEGL